MTEPRVSGESETQWLEQVGWLGKAPDGTPEIGPWERDIDGTQREPVYRLASFSARTHCEGWVRYDKGHVEFHDAHDGPCPSPLTGSSGGVS